jgi:hypothetical protein
MIDHLDRMHLIGRGTYYLGWIAAILGAFVHFKFAARLFSSMNLSQRNLFEASVLFFLICTASEIRALVPPRSYELPVITKKQAA